MWLSHWSTSLRSSTAIFLLIADQKFIIQMWNLQRKQCPTLSLNVSTKISNKPGTPWSSISFSNTNQSSCGWWDLKWTSQSLSNCPQICDRSLWYTITQKEPRASPIVHRLTAISKRFYPTYIQLRIKSYATIDWRRISNQAQALSNR